MASTQTLLRVLYNLTTLIVFSNDLSPYMKQVFVLLFHRLSSSRTTKFVKGLIVFFCFYAVKYGASSLIGMVDSIQSE